MNPTTILNNRTLTSKIQGVKERLKVNSVVSRRSLTDVEVLLQMSKNGVPKGVTPVYKVLQSFLLETMVLSLNVLDDIYTLTLE